VIKRLWDEARLWGIEPVLAGNIKGFLDRYANPTTIIPEADKRHLDYRMATAFTDGTKLGVEMALVANALGLRVDVPGMHGPRATKVQEALTLFDLETGANRSGVVDYLLGAEPGGGVFVIGRCEEAFQRRMLAYYKMGRGPFYLFYRPYHLCHIEAMRSIAEACLGGVSLLKPDFGFQANVYAYAKRDLREGERLDGIGGYMCYGLVENAGESASNRGLPICLADGALLQHCIPRNEKILLEDVELSRNGDAWRLYNLALHHGGAVPE
jgi:predicted homoserine dehydrogenase-like protein